MVAFSPRRRPRVRGWGVAIEGNEKKGVITRINKDSLRNSRSYKNNNGIAVKACVSSWCEFELTVQGWKERRRTRYNRVSRRWREGPGAQRCRVSERAAVVGPPKVGLSHCALWHKVRVSEGAAVVGPPKGGSATALSGSGFRMSEEAAVVGPPKGGSATALSGTVFRVSERAAVVVPQEGGLNHRAL